MTRTPWYSWGRRRRDCSPRLDQDAPRPVYPWTYTALVVTPGTYLTFHRADAYAWTRETLHPDARAPRALTLRLRP